MQPFNGHKAFLSSAGGAPLPPEQNSTARQSAFGRTAVRSSTTAYHETLTTQGGEPATGPELNQRRSTAIPSSSQTRTVNQDVCTQQANKYPFLLKTFIERQCEGTDALKGVIYRSRNRSDFVKIVLPYIKSQPALETSFLQFVKGQESQGQVSNEVWRQAVGFDIGLADSTDCRTIVDRLDSVPGCEHRLGEFGGLGELIFKYADIYYDNNYVPEEWLLRQLSGDTAGYNLGMSYSDYDQLIKIKLYELAHKENKCHISTLINKYGERFYARKGIARQWLLEEFKANPGVYASNMSYEQFEHLMQSFFRPALNQVDHSYHLLPCYIGELFKRHADKLHEDFGLTPSCLNAMAESDKKGYSRNMDYQTLAEIVAAQLNENTDYFASSEFLLPFQL